METIDIINKNLEESFLFPLNYINIINKELITEVYLNNEFDYHLYGKNEYHLKHIEEYQKIIKWMTAKLFFPLIKAAIQGDSIAIATSTTKVRLRIATNMVMKIPDNKISSFKVLSNQIKLDTVEYITQAYWNRQIACSDYYFKYQVPF